MKFSTINLGTDNIVLVFGSAVNPTGIPIFFARHEVKILKNNIKFNLSRELIRQAFAAWEIVIAMEFLETNKPQDAQIIFSVGDQKRNSTTGRTG